VSYTITIKKSAAKEIELLPKKILSLITSSILSLAENPRPQGCKKLKGSKSDFWRIRIGDYRVLYTIADEIRIVDVQKVGHRKDIYE
jgi:mRNA interferase RelE/StbE